MNYTYTLTFFIGALADLNTAFINGRYASDNGTASVALNGPVLGAFPLNSPGGAAAFNSWTGFIIPAGSGFQLGANTLTWTVQNGGSFNPSGLRVEFFRSDVSDTVPEPSSILLGGLGLVVLGIARRRRQS